MNINEFHALKNFGKASEQLLNAIVDGIETAVIVHDRNLGVIFVNDAFEHIYGIAREDTLGKSPTESLPEFNLRHKKAIRERLENVLKTGVKSDYHEFTYYSPTGQYRYLSSCSIPIFNQNNKILYVMSLVTDMTRRKELEQNAIKAAKLSSVSDTAHALAHEINNPLTGIRLALSTLSKNLQTKDNLKILESVIKNFDRIQTTVRSFLKARQEHISLKKTNLTVIGDMVEDVLFHLSEQLRSKHIFVEQQLTKESFYIFIDRDRLHRVLLNLLLNSIQAIREKGKIVIMTSIASPYKNQSNGEVFFLITISDNGVGFDPKHAQEIYQPFYSSKPEGTGLGMSICKDIISTHQGFMQVDSDLGKGTTVRIYLPVERVN